MPDVKSREQKAFLNWLTETYNLEWTYLDIPETLWTKYSKTNLPNDPQYQHWAKYIRTDADIYTEEEIRQREIAATVAKQAAIVEPLTENEKAGLDRYRAQLEEAVSVGAVGELEAKGWYEKAVESLRPHTRPPEDRTEQSKYPDGVPVEAVPYLETNWNKSATSWALTTGKVAVKDKASELQARARGLDVSGLKAEIGKIESSTEIVGTEDRRKLSGEELEWYETLKAAQPQAEYQDKVAKAQEGLRVGNIQKDLENARRAAASGIPSTAGAPRGTRTTGEIPTAPTIPEIPRLGEFAESFTKGLPYGMQRFVQRGMEDIGQRFGQARDAWWKMLNTPTPATQQESSIADVLRMRQIADYRAPETVGDAFGGLSDPQSLRAAELRGQAGALETQVREAGAPRVAAGGVDMEVGGAGELGYATPPPKDPTKAAIKAYPWYEEYIKIPPRERGRYSGRFNPRAGWFR